MSTHDEVFHDLEVALYCIELRVDLAEARLDSLAEQVELLQRRRWWHRFGGGDR